MTIVAVWYESSDDCVWCVADTRVSKSGQSGRIVLTDSAAKIFSLKVRSKIVNRENFPGRTYFERDFGFAYAGNSLPALMTFSTASTFLQNLMSNDGYERIPSLEEIGWHVRKLAERFSKEMVLANPSPELLFEAVIFGECPRSKEFEIFRFETNIVEQSASVKMLRQPHNGEITVLGSGKEQFQLHLDRIMKEGVYKTRLPKHAVRATIESGTGTDVGGHISQAIANRRNFELYLTHDPATAGKPRGRVHFNGIALDELGTVGPCIFGVVGMAG